MLPLAPELGGPAAQEQVASKGVQVFAGKLNVHGVCMSRCIVLQGKRQT